MNQMLSRVKKSKNTSRPETLLGRNEQGQAMVEYVLMLIISVALVLALTSQIFKPFGQFIDSYMGAYVGCLLEYGELPTLGSSEASEVDGDSECNRKFAEGTLAGGRPPRDGSNGDSSGAANGSSSNSSSGSGDSGGNGGSSGSYAGSSSRGGSRFINSGRRPSQGVESGGAAEGKVVEIAADGNGGNSYFGRGTASQRVVRVRKSMPVGIAGLTEAEKKKLEKKANGGGGVVVSTEGVGQAPKKTIVKPPPAKAYVDEEKPLTVGNFIRYLFIAALVLALVVFIGGQALQMSKSAEK